MAIKLQVVGRMRSGKDTVWEILNKHFPQYNIQRVAYADILKKECIEIMRLAYSVMETGGMKLSRNDFLEVIQNKTFMRKMYINYGTGIVRNRHNPDAWYEAACKKHNDLFLHDSYVITDTRFKNELDNHSKRYETKTILIRCDKEILWGRYHKSFPKSSRTEWEEFYKSETEQLSDEMFLSGKGYDEVIFNESTYDIFEKQVLGTIRRLFEKHKS